MIVLLSVGLVCGAACWIAWRYTEVRSAEVKAFALEREYERLTRGTLERDLAKIKADAKIAIARVMYPEAVAHPSKSSDIVLPDDLEAHVMQWSDEWARDDERANVIRLYLEHHTGDASQTWQKVRRFVGIGELP